MNKMKTIAAAMLAFAVSSASAEVISIDFNNTTDPNWTISGTEVAGPLGSAHWNTTTTAAGAGQALVDDTGAATTATITWNAANTWTNGDGGSNGLDGFLSHAYLDDSAGVSITVENIPYTTYKVYGLFASGSDKTPLLMLDFQVNGSWVIGGASAVNDTTVYGTVAGNIANNGESWTEMDPGSTIGNYWTLSGLTGSTLTINGQAADGSSNLRGSLTGVIIQAIPEPSSYALMGGLLALASVMIRRRK